MLTKREKSLLIDLVRHAVMVAIEGGGKDMDIPEDALTDALWEKKGVFLAIYTGNSLRGCIGSVLGVLPLWQACMEYAHGAAIKDIRFSPIKRDELASLSYEITIAGPAHILDDPSKLRPGRDGLILKKGFRQEAFLPGSLAELVKDPQSIFDHLKTKAGIDSEDESSEVWEVFEAEVFS